MKTGSTFDGLFSNNKVGDRDVIQATADTSPIKEKIHEENTHTHTHTHTHTIFQTK